MPAPPHRLTPALSNSQTITTFLIFLPFLLCAGHVWAQSGEQVLLVVNRSAPGSREVADYYRPRRSVPVKNVCNLDATTDEEVSWDTYLGQVERPIAACLEKNGLRETVLYIVLTQGVPLKVEGSGRGMQAEYASVDSELTLLYGKLKGAKYARMGPLPNPFFMKRYARFSHPQFPIYLVTRLAAYDVADVKAMIDRSLRARNRGKFVIDDGGGKSQGDEWLRAAATLLPAARVVQESTPAVVYGAKEVIGYASWGSNDGGRTLRWLGFEWLPGAVATEYVSTNARTLKRPPDAWVFGPWEKKQYYFGGSPQGLSADYLHEGATGMSGNAYEPFLGGCVRPEFLLPAYYRGRNLAESYYVGMPFLSWQGVIFGDPLCSLGKP
jgi:uncharacterized protein (TIGR03790 family)